MKERLYFAYGSNCNLGQMERRCPNAVKVGAVTLRNYKLTFNGRTRGGGVASIKRSNGKEVLGLLWKITPECERSLDHYEGYPHLYEKKTVTVWKENGEKVKAMVYVMTAQFQNPAIPSENYLFGIVDGFRENGMDVVPVWTAVAETRRLCEKAGQIA